jgi:hypothetical protein
MELEGALDEVIREVVHRSAEPGGYRHELIGIIRKYILGRGAEKQ